MKTNKFTIVDYAKMAIVLLFYNNKADAQVIYTDLDPDIELQLDNATIGIDMDNNGIVDFMFLRTSGSYYHYLGYSDPDPQLRFRQADWVLPFGSINGILGDPATSSGGGINNIPAALYTNVLIDSYKYFQHSSLQVMSYGFYVDSAWHYAFGTHPWNTVEGENKYLGVKFIGSDECIHYGWIRCEIEDSCKRLIIKDYAFELECDAPIAAGSMVSYVDVENENTFDGTVFSFDKTVYVKLNGQNNNPVIHLYDIHGKEVYSREIQDQFTEIKLTVVPGIYLVEIIADEGRYTKKVYLD
jgi:hypothetical protein